MKVPFHKAHGAGNDFLFTFQDRLDDRIPDGGLPELARAICHRHTGVGADGWYLVGPSADCDASILLYNSDGSHAELSGNGTRCAAALLVREGVAGPGVRILTGAGPKSLQLIDGDGRLFRFEMDMGMPVYKPEDLRTALPLAGGAREVAILDVGNPQCAVVVGRLDFDWKKLGAEIEAHPRFPKRTNVSFLRPADDHSIEARFYERGAGPTLSSGTGSMGAAVAAILLGLVASPVCVRTEAGVLEVRWESGAQPVYLTGPAEITAQGDFFW